MTNHRSSNSAADDAISAFGSLVSAETRINGGNRGKAIATVARREPELHEQYLRATNPSFAAYARADLQRANANVCHDTPSEIVVQTEPHTPTTDSPRPSVQLQSGGNILDAEDWYLGRR